SEFKLKEQRRGRGLDDLAFSVGVELPALGITHVASVQQSSIGHEPPEKILQRLVAGDRGAELLARVMRAGESGEPAAVFLGERARLALGAVEILDEGLRIRARIEIGQIPLRQGAEIGNHCGGRHGVLPKRSERRWFRLLGRARGPFKKPFTRARLPMQNMGKAFGSSAARRNAPCGAVNFNFTLFLDSVRKRGKRFCPRKRWGLAPMASTILIADDDPVQRRLLEAMIRRFGYETECVESGELALARLTATDFPPIALLVLDLVMPDLDGMCVLARMRDEKLQTPVIVETAHGSIEAVISAMRAGAADFVVKPVGAERLQISIKNALAADALAGEVRRAARRAQGFLTFKDLVSRSAEMARVIRLGERAARSTIPVLIEGESGVGKEIVARAIQGASDRRGKSFVTVNCGALPANLVESILFGHEKGAFTGATEKHAGKFVEANGGTLFLDEVG